MQKDKQLAGLLHRLDLPIHVVVLMGRLVIGHERHVGGAADAVGLKGQGAPAGLPWRNGARSPVSVGTSMGSLWGLPMLRSLTIRSSPGLTSWPSASDQHDWAVHGRRVAGPGKQLHVQGHWQVDLHDITGFPVRLAGYRNRDCWKLLGGAVDRDRRLLSPRWMANFNVNFCREAAVISSRVLPVSGKSVVCLRTMSFSFHASVEGDKEIDEERILLRAVRRAAEIDRVAVLGVVLHARAGAAPEGIERRAEELEISRPGGLEIRHHPGVRVLRCEDGVVERALVVVGVDAPADRA